jgi:hypothetical protein
MSIIDANAAHLQHSRKLGCAGIMEGFSSITFADEHSMRLVTGGKATSKKHVVSVWDVGRQAGHTELEKLAAPAVLCTEHTAEITGVCMNRNMVFSCSEDARVCCSDAQGGGSVWTMSKRALGVTEFRFNSIAMSPSDENVFLVGMNKHETHSFVLHTYDVRQRLEPIFSMLCGELASGQFYARSIYFPPPSFAVTQPTVQPRIPFIRCITVQSIPLWHAEPLIHHRI